MARRNRRSQHVNIWECLSIHWKHLSLKYVDYLIQYYVGYSKKYECAEMRGIITSVQVQTSLMDGIDHKALGISGKMTG